MTPLTRREFLAGFVPRWMNRRFLRLAGYVTLLICLAVVVASVVRPDGGMRSLKGLAVVVALGLVLVGVRKVSAAVEQARAKCSEDMRSFLSSLERAVSIIVAMALGAFLYSEWQAGADVTGKLAILGFGLALSLFSEVRK